MEVKNEINPWSFNERSHQIMKQTSWDPRNRVTLGNVASMETISGRFIRQSRSTTKFRYIYRCPTYVRTGLMWHKSVVSVLLTWMRKRKLYSQLCIWSVIFSTITCGSVYDPQTYENSRQLLGTENGVLEADKGETISLYFLSCFRVIGVDVDHNLNNFSNFIPMNYKLREESYFVPRETTQSCYSARLSFQLSR